MFVRMTHSFCSLPCISAPFLFLFFQLFCPKNKAGFAYKQAPHYKSPCANIASMLISLFPVTLLSQQQRKEREMVRQQEKGPHRRLDDMRREEDRRLAEREQVTNHGRCGAAIGQSLRSVGVSTSNTVQVALVVKFHE